MANGGQYDGVVRPVIFGAIAVFVLGLAWQYWYISVPVVLALGSLYLWAVTHSRRARRRP